VTRISLAPPPPDPVLRPLLRARLPDLGLALRVLAEDVTGLEGKIDAVTVDPRGRVVLVLAATSGRDLELLANALAQRQWLRERLPDWLKLAPGLGIESDAEVRLLLLAQGFGPRALAAVRESDPEGIDLAVYRCVRSGAERDVLLEPLFVAGAEIAAYDGVIPVAAASFRTGLTDADLGLNPSERRIFD
jgi:hypothetical protein